ncbi:transketolase [Candidatus Micrarchaeota archaeon]|nr:transketolase [Candidatus Micrarchaeota archaeon]
MHHLEKIAKRLRIQALRMTTRAGSGHPTTALSAAELGTALFFGEMHIDTSSADNPGNDDFVLSKGHATALLWPIYAEAGIITHSDLQEYRTFASPLEGHPTPGVPWVKAATGSLGQGLNVSLGMAVANKILDLPGRVYCLMGDGELAEGSVWEAAELAGYREAANLCLVADINRQGQSDPTMVQHDLGKYKAIFESFGWKTFCIDGHDFGGITAAFEGARSEEKKPSAILAKTFKGRGVSFLEDKPNWHGKPLSEEQLQKALQELGPMPEIDAKKYVKPARKISAPVFEELPELSAPVYEKDEATRLAFANALTKLGSCRQVVVVDGDVKNSTYTEKFLEKYPDRFVECFIAEQNMVGICIGLSAKKLLPVCSTFAAFFSRAHDFIRMAAYSRSNIKFVGTHVGVSIGEDGPSQMGLEDLAMFRSVPGSVVLYPGDAVAAEKLMREALAAKGIVYMRTNRPKTPVIYKSSEEFPIGGSKAVRKHEADAVTIVSGGVTLHEALKAADELEKRGIDIQVIDCYSVKPLDVQGIKRAAARTNNKVIVVEDHFAEGGIGEAVASQVTGLDMRHLAVRGIPRSGKPTELLAYFGIDASGIEKAVEELL